MTKNEIVELLGKKRVVEKMVQNISHHPLDADLADLVQMVYIALLEYDEASVKEMWEAGQINFFIARIILNQYRSNFSPFYRCIRKYQKRAEELGSRDVASDEDEILLGALSSECGISPKENHCNGNLEELVSEFKDIKKEYSYNGDVMCQDSVEIRRLKFIIEHDLNVVDRTIILLYADCESLRKLGAQLGVSHQTIRNEVNRIRKIVFEKLEEK